MKSLDDLKIQLYADGARPSRASSTYTPSYIKGLTTRAP